MLYLRIAVFAVILLACNNAEESAGSTLKDSVASTQPYGPDSNEQDKNLPSVRFEEACFMQVVKKDTIVLHLQKNGNKLSGRLNFDNYQKDGSSGTVEGIQEGEILKLIYSFSSEGMNSVMEVFFRKKGNDLVRGVGEMTAKNDTVYFVQPGQVTYPENAVLKKVDCTEVPDKYK